MPRQYRPGSRRGYRQSDGRMSKNRVAWARLVIGQLILMRGYSDEESVEEEKDVRQERGSTYRILITRSTGGRPAQLNLTALTHEEFLIFKEFMLMAMDLAEPVIKLRDKVAQDAFDKGDDSFARIYRQVPQLVVREGTIGDDSEGVLDGLENLPDGDLSGERDGGEVPTPDGGVRGVGDELASGEPSEDQPEDDQPQAN
jgi:hypothetical protein